MGLSPLPRALRGIDALSDAAGRVAGVLAVALVVLAFGLVLVRYVFNAGSVAAQEGVLWLHASAFLLGLCYALRHGNHVRVDVFSQRWSARTRAWTEFVGCALLLLPFCVFILTVSWEYVAASWSAREGSRDPGGLPGWYLLKTLLPLSALLLLLQGVAEALRALMAALAKDAA
jgi:TRAP-type mannitol/chloroaromatic compound transport system permease small subunit